MTPPLLAGGQGRSPRDVKRAARSLAFYAIVAALAVAAAIAAGCTP